MGPYLLGSIHAGEKPGVEIDGGWETWSCSKTRSNPAMTRGAFDNGIEVDGGFTINFFYDKAARSSSCTSEGEGPRR